MLHFALCNLLDILLFDLENGVRVGLPSLLRRFSVIFKYSSCSFSPTALPGLKLLAVLESQIYVLPFLRLQVVGELSSLTSKIGSKWKVP